MDAWIEQLSRVGRELEHAMSDEVLLPRSQRRRLLEQQVGEIRRLRKLSRPELAEILAGGTLVGVDGSINRFGGNFPHYIALLRAMAKPTRGVPIVEKDVHVPLLQPEIPVEADETVRQAKMAALEIRAATLGLERFAPRILLLDGPLVRFYMRSRESFTILARKSLVRESILLGIIENIESRVISSILDASAPPGWAHQFDRDLLYDTLDPGEVLVVRQSAKVSFQPEAGAMEAADGEVIPIFTFFARLSEAPDVIGIDLLAEQVDRVIPLLDYLYSLTPARGRGIPIWLDVVDKEVRLTDTEIATYISLLPAGLRRRLLSSKREERVY
jgi:hypothetical protein